MTEKIYLSEDVFNETYVAVDIPKLWVKKNSRYPPPTRITHYVRRDDVQRFLDGMEDGIPMTFKASFRVPRCSFSNGELSAVVSCGTTDERILERIAKELSENGVSERTDDLPLPYGWLDELFAQRKSK